MKKRAAPALDVLMNAASPKSEDSANTGQKAVGLPSEEVPAHLIDSLVDASSYSPQQNKAATQVATVGEPVISENITAPTLSENTCVVQGQVFELDKEITIDVGLVTEEFKGNTRNSRQLRNIDELAEAIIPAGHNSEPVKVRPLPDGSGFELIKGKRRTASVRRANELTTDKVVKLRTIIALLDDRQALEEAAMENTHNELLTPWEFADQLQALLDGGVATYDTINCYLPPDKKKAARTTVINWLHPARINANVRKYVDESADVTNAMISKLYTRVTKIFESGGEKSLLNKMASTFLVGKHEVRELLHFLDNLDGNTTQRTVSGTRSITNSAGKPIADLKQKSNGGLSVDFDKSVPKSEIDAVLVMIEQHLSNLTLETTEG